MNRAHDRNAIMTQLRFASLPRGPREDLYGLGLSARWLLGVLLPLAVLACDGDSNNPSGSSDNSGGVGGATASSSGRTSSSTGSSAGAPAAAPGVVPVGPADRAAA